MSQSKSDYKRLQVTLSDYEPDEWLEVTTSQTMIKMPQSWVKRIFTSQKVIYTANISMISDIWIVN